MLDPTQSYRPHILENLGAFCFAPLVNTNYALVAAIDLLFLRPEPPGRLITQGGDIDNRLKTLFDALRMPRVLGEIPHGDQPTADETPFFCLLQDDALITEINVRTDVLLAPKAQPSDAELVMQVKTAPVRMSFDNMDL